MYTLQDTPLLFDSVVRPLEDEIIISKFINAGFSKRKSNIYTKFDLTVDESTLIIIPTNMDNQGMIQMNVKFIGTFGHVKDIYMSVTETDLLNVLNTLKDKFKVFSDCNKNIIELAHLMDNII